VNHIRKDAKNRQATRDLGNGQSIQWKGFDCSPFRKMEFGGEGIWIQRPDEDEESE
jgi:hypothetical protein